MSESAFLFGLSAARLRGRSVWGGIVLAVAVLLPYEVIDGRAQFFWELVGELSNAGRIALFAGAASGIAIAVAPRLATKSTSLACVVLAALLSAALVSRIGAEAVRWDAVSLPESLTKRWAFTELALALTAAGAALRARPAALRPARFALILGPIVAFLVYVWPARGEPPLLAAGRGLLLLGELPFRYGLGVLFVIAAVIGPGVVCFAGLYYLKNTPRQEQPKLTLLALFGQPALLLLFVYRALIMGAVGPGMLVGLATAFTTLARVALLAASFEVLGAAFAPKDEVDEEIGAAPKVAASVALAAVIVLGGAEWVMARPPEKGTRWEVAEATPEAKKLFEETLPGWIRARLIWDSRVRRTSNAADMIELKSAARNVATLARAVSPKLAEATSALTTESDDLDLAGRRWFHLVGDLNDASREAHLPYYVDPLVYSYATDDGMRRSFRLQTYAIAAVHRVTAAGKPFAALHVKSAGPRFDGRRLLGFSRDAQPFALVELDEIANFQKELGESGHATPPRCYPGASDPDNEACGAVLATTLAKLGDGLGSALERITERHELQHQIDGPDLAVVGPVHEILPSASDDFQERVNRELSAYIAEITTKDAPPALGIVNLAGFASGRRSPEHYVALIILGGLTGQKLTRGSEVDRERVTCAVATLAKEDEASLRHRAIALWEKLFRGRLVDPEPTRE